MARFALVLGDEVIKLFDFTKDRILVGRHEQADVVIPNRAVSRHHAIIESVEGKYVIKEFKSKNGIFFQGKRVLFHAFRVGDEVYVGKYAIRYLGAGAGSSYGVSQTELTHGSEAFKDMNKQDFIEATVAMNIEEIRKKELLKNVAKIPVLQQLEGAKVVAEHRMTKAKLVVGKDKYADIKLKGFFTPSRHSEIEKRGTKVFLVNLTARPPVLVNGQPMVEGRLWDEDVIDIGPLRLLFREPKTE